MSHREVSIAPSTLLRLIISLFILIAAGCNDKSPKPVLDQRSSIAEDVFRQSEKGVVQIVTFDEHNQIEGLGSGFVIRADGVIVTNWHVIEAANSAKVVTSDGEEFEVKGTLAIDRSNDLALLKVNGDALAVIPLASSDARMSVGQRVYAIGNPQGFTNTMSEGVVSAIRKHPEADVTVLQTTAAISKGSSGGPLLNSRGEAVGVVFATLTSGQNINFAIPVSCVHSLFTQEFSQTALAQTRVSPRENASNDRQATPPPESSPPPPTPSVPVTIELSDLPTQQREGLVLKDIQRLTASTVAGDYRKRFGAVLVNGTDYPLIEARILIRTPEGKARPVPDSVSLYWDGGAIAPGQSAEVKSGSFKCSPGDTDFSLRFEVVRFLKN